MMELSELLDGHDEAAAAIGAPGRQPMSYGRLREVLAAAQTALAGVGVEDGDAVALAVPNGPEALAATLAAASTSAVAPLNPSFTEPEFRFYLEDLSAGAFVVSDECGERAASAARDLGVPLLRLVPDPGGPAGAFRLEQPAGAVRAARPRSGTPAHPEGTALLLHTSGTTARPKLVGLKRRALATSARRIAGSLQLGPSDVSLNVMPLFHVHGLVGAALSTLASGGLACCTPGFNALRFAGWLDECHATWYTAVPSMHQALLRRMRADGAARRDRRTHRAALRFVRSCSSPLPAAVQEGLEAFFDVQVVNAYGMTEAAHQVACTPLGAAGREAAGNGESGTVNGEEALGNARRTAAPRGSVGLPTGPELRILGTDGNWLPAGATGEIALHGETVIAAYERPAEANATSFHEGWLRTGDEGVVDREGFVTLTGRLKELINTGGEKVSPYEVEDALLRHPAVAEAVCFGIPHRTRGEAVGVAVALVAGGNADERGLRRFLAGRLAPCKVPDRVLVLPQIPKGPTGKLQRIGLATALGLEP